MTVKSKKRRLKRAQAHAKRLDHRGQAGTRTGRFSVRSPHTEGLKQSLLKRTFVPVSIAAIREFTVRDHIAESDRISRDTDIALPPSRAKCPACGFSQKVRKDGTLGKHSPTRTDTSECIGSGKQWNAS